LCIRRQHNRADIGNPEKFTEHILNLHSKSSQPELEIMSPKQVDLSDKVSHAFLLVEDARPCLCFHSEGDAAAFVKEFPGAESYYNKQHVFIPKPFGLESVAGAKSGETAFSM
jgi:hypothetical protein